MKLGEAFSSMVILKAKNPKTQEVVPLSPFKLPPTHKHLAEKATFLEAKHFAAAYALFRVCSMRNIHMMLPPTFRDLWKGDFDALKKEDVKEGKAWMYEADPFATLREREEAKAQREKHRLEQEKAKQKAANTPGGIALALHGSSGSGSGASNVLRGWTRVPKVDMGKKSRAQVEALIRRHGVWNPNNIKIAKNQQQAIVDELKKLGFRQSHVEEAVGVCKDREETIEWLLIHVPEDDLPSWALPEGYVTGISMASSDLKRESAIKRLHDPGYGVDLCAQMYDKYHDEALAATALQELLLGRVPEASSEAGIPSQSFDKEVFEEESSSISSVFGEQYKQVSEDAFEVAFKPVVVDAKENKKPTVRIRFTRDYPQTVPVVTIHAAVPAYIRLSLMKRVLTEAMSSWLGDHMVFFIIDWLEQNYHVVLKNPGKLTEVSAVASSASEAVPPRHHRTKPASHPKPLKKTPDLQSKDLWQRRQLDPKLELRIKQRRTLPAWELKDDIVDAVTSHQVTIISGETGSGKSTQSAQFILDDLYSRALGEATNIM